jgi:hypothetical protein
VVYAGPLQHAICQLNLADRPCSDGAAQATCVYLLACSASGQLHCLRRAVAWCALDFGSGFDISSAVFTVEHNDIYVFAC